jgi:hypothetical protein
MKKTLVLAALCVFVCASAFAQPKTAKKADTSNENVALQSREEMKKLREEMKKEKKELDDLSEKYKKATDAEKPAIEAQVKAKVSANYDKNLARTDTQIIKAKERLAKREIKQTEAKNPEVKKKHVDETVQKILTGKKSARSKTKKESKNIGKDKKTERKK